MFHFSGIHFGHSAFYRVFLCHCRKGFSLKKKAVCLWKRLGIKYHFKDTSIYLPKIKNLPTVLISCMQRAFLVSLLSPWCFLYSKVIFENVDNVAWCFTLCFMWDCNCSSGLLNCHIILILTFKACSVSLSNSILHLNWYRSLCRADREVCFVHPISNILFQVLTLDNSRTLRVT